jgi:hypothetical protein
MEIDRETLIKLLEAFADASEVLHRELMLYQLLFTAACKAKGLTEGEIQKAVNRVRMESTETINEVSRATHQGLLAKLPQLVDLLASDQDAALRFLEEWDSRGLPN